MANQRTIDLLIKFGLDQSAAKRVLSGVDSLEDAFKDVEKIGKRAFERVGDELTQLSRKADNAANEVEGIGKRFKSAFAGGVIGGLVAGIGQAALDNGIEAIKQSVDAAIVAQASQQNLAMSIQAAQREFANVGSIQSWQQNIESLSDQLSTFSNQDVNDATTRLIDMTKRLGLTEDEMTTVLSRTADLSAGKVDLSGGIERVTAALRGEAESAEYLGLSLNETQVRQYAESQGLVWKNLTESEKVLQRFNLFLDQTNAIQDRASQYATTFAGRQAALNKELENSRVIIGQQLLPLWEGYVNLLGLAANQTGQSSGIITDVLAAMNAAMVAFGATVFIIFKANVERINAFGDAVVALYDSVVNLSDPTEGLTAAYERFNKAQADGEKAADSFGESFKMAFEQFRQSYTEIANADPAQDIIPPLEFISDQITDTAEDYEKAVEKIKQANEQLATSTARAAADLAKDISRRQIDALQDASREREDIARKDAQKIDDIERQHSQKLADAAKELGRERSKIERNYGRDRAKIDRDLANERSGIERDYRRTLRDIQRDYAASIEDAVLNQDVQAFLQAQQERQRSIEDAKLQRSDDTQDAVINAQRQREELKLSKQAELEDARIANQQKIEDLRVALEQEFEQQRIANERDLEEQRIKEQRKNDDLKQFAVQRAADQLLEFKRRYDDLQKALEKELELIREYERKKREAQVGGTSSAGRSAGTQGRSAGGTSGVGRRSRFASGGYASAGIYELGEAGREFVLNAGTTSALEQMLGRGLTQANVTGAVNRSYVNQPTININGAGDPALTARMVQRQIEDTLMRAERGY